MDIETAGNLWSNVVAIGPNTISSKPLQSLPGKGTDRMLSNALT